MHQRSLSELQGVSTQERVFTLRTNQDQASRTSKLRRGSGCLRLCPGRGAHLWAWLLLGALVVPGAWSFLSEEQEELLVELHNHYRGQVSPSASAMMPLKWDTNLKVIAEGYAAKCIWNHNPELEDTGENLFAGTGSLDLREALEKWFLERMNYDFNNNSCDEDMMCGHYTQMVWADTHRVGCAFHLCNNMEELDWERVSFLVCNYYPAGNYEGERPYVEGDWCSRCPENLQKCENNLCVPDTVDDEELDMEDEDEEATVVPPPTTSKPSLQPAEEEEEESVALPPAATEPYVEPVVTTTPSTPVDEEAAADTATDATAIEESHDDTQPPEATPSLGSPNAPSTTLKDEEEKEEEVAKAEGKIPGEKDEKIEREMGRKIFQNTKVDLSNAGSVFSASLLLVCLTGILTLRL